MVLPGPESDLRMNLVVLGNDILSEFQRKKELFIDDLLKKFLKKDVRRTPSHFLDVITFLYSIDLIELKDYKLKVIKYGQTQKNLF